MAPLQDFLRVFPHIMAGAFLSVIQGKGFRGRIALTSIGLSRIQRLLYSRTFQSLQVAETLVTLQDGNTVCGVSQAHLIPFHGMAYGKRIQSDSLWKTLSVAHTLISDGPVCLCAGLELVLSSGEKHCPLCGQE